jgi:NAD(P)-dependent dehydrogenase (short-subunit alcohol dehydrogenase family)
MLKLSIKMYSIKAWAALSKANPLQRTGTVDEIAKAIGFLASDQSSFITGETICIDGGAKLTTSMGKMINSS